MPRTNYYLLLELSLDPPVLDPALIEKEIEEKRSYWNRNRNHPTNAAKYKRYGEMVPEIMEVLLNPGLLKREIEEARKQILRELDRAIADCAADGEISPEELSYLEKNFPQFRRQTIIDRLPVPMNDTRSGDRALAPPPKPIVDPELKLPDTLTMERIEANLEVLRKKDLYDYLKLRPSCTCERLLQAAKEKEEENRKSSKKTAEVDAGGVLSGLAAKMFANQLAKKSYDARLRVWKFEKELQPVMIRRSLNEVRSADKKLQHRTVAPADYRKSVEEARELGLSAVEAEWYVYDFYVTKRKCSDPRSAEPHSGETRKVQCSICYRLNDPDAKNCRECGMPLVLVCPRCRRACGFGSVHCPGCGFSVGDMPIALDALKAARELLLRDDPEAARGRLETAKLLWPGLSEAAPLGREIDRRIERNHALRRELDNIVTEILEAIRARRFHRAESALFRLRSRDPRHPLLEHKAPEVDAVLSEVNRKLEAAGKLPSPAEQLKAYEQILDLCADSELARERIGRIPLTPPKNITLTTNSRGVEIRWARSEIEGNIRYLIVRKEGSPPVGPADGKALSEHNAHDSFLDEDAEPGIPYAYAVFARRGESPPERIGAKSGLIMREPFLQRIAVVPGDGKLEFRWRTLRNMTRLRIVRFNPGAPGQGVAISSGYSEKGFVDTGLRNESPYEYIVNIGYKNLDGREKFTPDEFLKGTPSAPPDLVRGIKVRYAVGAIGMQWTVPKKGDLYLFESGKPFKEPCGKVVSGSVEELSNLYGQPLVIADPVRGTTVWPIEFSGTRYVLPVTVAGEVMIFGETLEIRRVQDVAQVRSRTLDGKLYLTWDWPEGLEKVLIAIRTDNYPTGPGDGSATKKVLSLKEYRLDEGFVFQQPLRRNLFVTIYSVLEDRGKVFYSPGVRHQTEKTIITYKIEFQKGLFFTRTKPKIVIEVLSGYARMPAMVAMKSFGRAPLRRDDGYQVLNIPARMMNRQEIPLDSSELGKNSYLRLFIEKEGDREEFSLLDPWQEEMQLW